MFVVTVKNGGNKFWLRGTAWVSSEDGAEIFQTAESAKAAAVEAEEFMALVIKRRYIIEKL